jgi:hypothetical protein
VRYLTAGTHPDHDTICKFRRDNFDAVAEAFLGILVLAKELKVLKVGTVSTDGSKIKANASKNRNVAYERAGELVEQLKQEVNELLLKAEEADRSELEEGQQLPKEIARHDALKAKLEKAREDLEQRAKKKAAAKPKAEKKTAAEKPTAEKPAAKKPAAEKPAKKKAAPKAKAKKEDKE